MQCTNKQPVPRVPAEFVHVRSNNWEGQRWSNWFVAVAKIIEQFLSLMLVVCCWLTHTHTHRRPGLLRTGCSLKSSSNNEVPNRSHQSLSREILVSPTVLHYTHTHTHGGDCVSGARAYTICRCVCQCAQRGEKKDTFSACLKYTSKSPARLTQLAKIVREISVPRPSRRDIKQPLNWQPTAHQLHLYLLAGGKVKEALFSLQLKKGFYCNSRAMIYMFAYFNSSSIILKNVLNSK